MDKYEVQVKCMEQVVFVFGGVGVLSIVFVMGYRFWVCVVLDVWDSVVFCVFEGDDIFRKVFRCVKYVIVLLCKGKENMKDCIVIEIYFEVVQ